VGNALSGLARARRNVFWLDARSGSPASTLKFDERQPNRFRFATLLIWVNERGEAAKYVFLPFCASSASHWAEIVRRIEINVGFP
jgi:hypothetical protein